jgi:hypothetical protein
MNEWVRMARMPMRRLILLANDFPDMIAAVASSA